MKTLLIAAAAAALLAASAAQAGHFDARFERSVPVADLDLRSTAGADALIGRLEAAARSACRGQPMVDQYHGAARERACAAKAVVAAVARLDAPLVTARLLTRNSPAMLANR